jgi:hypothetical protein
MTSMVILRRNSPQSPGIYNQLLESARVQHSSAGGNVRSARSVFSRCRPGRKGRAVRPVSEGEAFSGTQNQPNATRLASAWAWCGLLCLALGGGGDGRGPATCRRALPLLLLLGGAASGDQRAIQRHRARLRSVAHCCNCFIGGAMLLTLEV